MKPIDAEQLKQMQQRQEDFLLINTLDEKYFKNTRIEGAINVPQSDADFVDRVQQRAGSRDKKIVTYCANADCDSSAQGAEKLETAGFMNVYDFEAGAEGWKQAGQPLGAG